MEKPSSAEARSGLGRCPRLRAVRGADEPRVFGAIQRFETVHPRGIEVRCGSIGFDRRHQQRAVLVMGHAGVAGGQCGAAVIGGHRNGVELDVGVEFGAGGGVGEHRQRGVDPGEPAGSEPVGQTGIGEQQPHRARQEDPGRDVAGAFAAHHDGLRPRRCLEHPDAPVDRGVQPGCVHELVDQSRCAFQQGIRRRRANSDTCTDGRRTDTRADDAGRQWSRRW